MFNPITIGIGKLVQAVATLRGGGSALPGRVVEKLDPHFAAKVLSELPHGVVLVSGTNGKTTTVKIVSELLEAAGLRVFTNNTGSNFMRGVISSLLRKVSLRGSLDADIAVLELDEAHAVTFVEEIKPRYTLLLNVMRDQLDRFGEIDYTAKLLSVVAHATTDVVVLNREDSLLAAIPKNKQLKAEVRWFGLAPELRGEFFEESDESETEGTFLSVSKDETGRNVPSVSLVSFEENTARFEIGGATYETPLALKGVYNAFNAAAALALVHAVAPQTRLDTLCRALSNVQSAFGRGEILSVNGLPVEMILVKNPDGFRLALNSFDPAGWATMIAVNDDYGDGRDVSWFFDVPFASLRKTGVSVVTGSRAYDMALRLEYDEVPIAGVNPDIIASLENFVSSNANIPKRIYCSYTMMMELRALLATKTEVKQIR